MTQLKRTAERQHPLWQLTDVFVNLTGRQLRD
jgi:hypothetical protein